jgi:hypothetical protein
LKLFFILIALQVNQNTIRRSKHKGKSKTHGHHSDSKYLGGDPKQKLTHLDVEDHIAIHKEIDKKYPRRKGKSYYDNLRETDPNFDEKVYRYLTI